MSVEFRDTDPSTTQEGQYNPILVLVLYQNEANAGLCTLGDSESGSGLISRVDAVNDDACCEQNGDNVCTGGEPEVCDAECAAEFLPYWHQCLDRVSSLGGEMRPFNTLHVACTDGLPQVEMLALHRDVTEMEDSPECTINTSAVVPMTEAKQNARLPTCETDTYVFLAPSSSLPGLNHARQTFVSCVPKRIRVITAAISPAQNRPAAGTVTRAATTDCSQKKDTLEARL